MPPIPSHLVVDAFGTIAHLARPTRPYAQMRSFLATCGAPVADFAVVAMTRPLGLAGLAEHYGVEVPMARLRAMEEALFEETESLIVSPAALNCLRGLIRRGVKILIGSNLALPYGVALRHALRGAGLNPERLGGPSGIACAFSYEMGLIKPDPRFYAAIAASAPRTALFLMVGDKQQEDHDAPVAQGWAAAPARLRAFDASEWEVIEGLFPR